MSSIAFDGDSIPGSRVAESTRVKMIHGLQDLIATLTPDQDGSTLFEAGHVEDIIRARFRRRKFFNPHLFGEPSWDMLLELYAAELSQRRVSVSSLCIASGVPPTTALRWISALHKEGLVRRENDPLDGRRHFIMLSDKGLKAISEYFSDLPRHVTPL